MSGLQVGTARHTNSRRGSSVVTARLGSPKRGADIVKTQADLRKERREQLGDGNIWEAVVDAHQRLTAEDVDLKKLLGTAFVIGITFGTAFQPTHNNGYLPVILSLALPDHLSVLCELHVGLHALEAGQTCSSHIAACAAILLLACSLALGPLCHHVLDTIRPTSCHQRQAFLIIEAIMLP